MARFVATSFLALLVLTSASPSFAATAAPAMGREVMVVTSQVDASAAGLSLLRSGGNAVDAAVAAAFALNVTQPQSTGIGGGGFILIRQADGSVIAIDGRETAPAAASKDMYVREGVAENASLLGPLAPGTPGIVAGLALALRDYGTRSLEEVLQPAIRLAEEGYAIGPYQASQMRLSRESGLTQQFPALAATHFPPEDEPIERGFVVVQEDLAATLRAIAAEGPEVFYSGWLAHTIADELGSRGGIMTFDDLAAYRPVLRQPVEGDYRGFTILSFPPPSSGATLIEALNILEGFDLRSLGAGSSASFHRLAEAMKLSFADRNAWIGDPGFSEVPLARLVDKGHADTLRQRINPSRWRRAPWTWGHDEVAIDVSAPGLASEGGGTAHLSVVDANGIAVAITQTINTSYGSGVVISGTGILMNNEMADFATTPSQPNTWGLVDTRGINTVAPGKRPRSSMSPTIVLDEGRLFLITGSPNGPRIVTAVLQTIVNVIDFEMDVQAAVSAPRIHHQWDPDLLFVDTDVPADVVTALENRGHRVVRRTYPSATETVMIDPQSGLRYGGTDPRRDGVALGF